MMTSQAAEVAKDILSSPKTAVLTGAATSATGIAKVMSWIPDDIGKAATLFGIVLTLVLVRNHLAARREKAEMHALNMEMRELEIAAMRRAAENHLQQDQPDDGGTTPMTPPGAGDKPRSNSTS